MLIKRGYGDLPKVYRPCSPYELYGQEEIKQISINNLKKGTFGHSYLFHGSSGTGKTTCARMIGMGLLCEHGPTESPCCQCEQCKMIMASGNPDFRELNNANFTGIDFMRNLKMEFVYAPFIARYKIIVFDECHRLSEAAQNMMLKEVEDVYEGVYFIFCSSDPEKIIEPLKNRCMSIKFRPVENGEIRHMLIDVCEWEGISYKDGILESIIHEAQGLPRNALFLLQKAVESGKVHITDDDKPYSIRHVQNKGRILVLSPHLVSNGAAFRTAIKKDVIKPLNAHEPNEHQMLEALPQSTAILLRILNGKLTCGYKDGVMTKALYSMIKDNKADIQSIIRDKEAPSSLVAGMEMKQELEVQANASLPE